MQAAMQQTGPILYQDMKRAILVVDDEDINRELLGAILDSDGCYNVLYAADGIEAMALIKEHYQSISAVLLDLLMPNMDGFEVIQAIKVDENYRRIPIIVLTSERQAEVKSLEMGAADFIPKPYDVPAVILARVKRTIELSEDRTVIQAMERDSLTGLLAKEFFFEYSTVTKHFYKNKDMDAVVLNIDHFHLINEIYGRETGDQVLQTIAKTIYQFVRDNEGTAARGEGDTFLLYIKRQSDYEPLLNLISNDLADLSDQIHAHVRMGVYQKTSGDSDIAAIFDRANRACNTIRGNFQQSIAYYDQELQKDAIFAERLIHDIHDGIEEKQFKVYYQPKYDIQSEVPVLKSAEALVRWQHPEFGMIPPGSFISLFEENGLIQKVDHFVWRQVAEHMRDWKAKYSKVVPISVNMSRIDVFDPGLESKLMGLMTEFGLSPTDFHLEITESAYSENSDQIISLIAKLRSDGFIVEMDDFGAGYSSLNMLTSMPIDVLKMDMTFVRNMHKDEKQLKMIEMIMEIADFLSVPVVAEGVEDEEQYEFLKKVGCDLIQGYYFSKPVPEEEFEQLLREMNQ
ncbi:MAG: EAL domain-containing protein [Lachnospiraceae bacterium]|nr:EAL domain-containing protein [Lachnospiraceae bacterium]MBR1568164.1 EAL domain-containing protein [Lachnospiraceae bacterium]